MKKVAFILSMLMLSVILIPNYSVSAETNQNELIIHEQKIAELYAERLEAISCGDKEREIALNNELKENGVGEITPQEIYEMTEEAMPALIVDNENYYLNVVSQDIRENGIDFTCRVVNATPKNQKCNLYQSGGIMLTNKNKFVAGVTNLLSTATGVVYGQVPYSEIAVTFFDIVKDISDAVNTTTVVSNVEASYTWNVTEMVSFVYLALNTGAYTIIGHYNMGSYYIGTVINSLKFENNIPISDGIFKEYRGEFMAENYGSGLTALRAYLNGESYVYNVLSSSIIYGVEGQKVGEVKLLNPYTPGEIK